MLPLTRTVLDRDSSTHPKPPSPKRVHCVVFTEAAEALAVVAETGDEHLSQELAAMSL